MFDGFFGGESLDWIWLLGLGCFSFSLQCISLYSMSCIVPICIIIKNKNLG